MSNLRKAIEDIHFRGEIRFNEPMSAHTSFQVGGPAEVFMKASSDDDVAAVMKLSRDFPVFLLGAGANILVADSRIRGIVLEMSGLDSCAVQGANIVAGAGAAVSDVAMIAADNGLSGLEFIYAMPGSVGGSVWMNARCYGVSISEILDFAEVIDDDGQLRRDRPPPHAFSYKVSPYQSERCAIVRAGFKLESGDKKKILEVMNDHRRDRDSKGHFAAPSAGSVFKNDKRFGMPTGKIIDSLSLRGTAVGNAQVSEAHANIIINRGSATAAEILELIVKIETRVHDEYGFELEREVRLVGAWEEAGDERRK